MASENNRARNLLHQEKNRSDAVSRWVPNLSDSLQTQLMSPLEQTDKMNRIGKEDNFARGTQSQSRVQLLETTKADGYVQKFLVDAEDVYDTTACPR